MYQQPDASDAEQHAGVDGSAATNSSNRRNATTAAEAHTPAASTAAQAPQMGPQLHTRAPAEICQYSDGAWEPPEQGSKDAPEPAGYGVVELECEREETRTHDDAATARSQESCEETYVPLRQLGERRSRDRRRGRVTWALSGTVETDQSSDRFIGAAKHTNNTGELTAMYYMIDRALRRRNRAAVETLHSDSLYAINMTTGKWMPSRDTNIEMIQTLRGMWRKLQRTRPNMVTIQHVRSHVGIPGNELADHLADMRGRGPWSDRQTTVEARAWLAAWMTDRYDDG